MKRNLMKKVLASALALAMALPLAACGDKGGDANAALAKENVYKVEQLQLPDLGGTDSSVLASIYKDDTLYMLAEVYDWGGGNDGPIAVYRNGNNSEIKLISMKRDGSDAKVVTLEMAAEEEADSQGTGTDAAGNTAADTGNAAVDTVNTTVDTGMVDSDNIWEYTGFSNYTLGVDGRIYAIKNYTYNDYSDMENPIYTNETYVSSWNLDGTLAREIRLEGLQTEDEWINITMLTVKEDGTINLILNGNSVYQMSIDAQGAVSPRKEASETASRLFANANQIFSGEDGKLLVLYYDENDWSKQYMATYDPASDTAGESAELPSAISWSGYYTLSAGLSSDLVYSNSTGIYTYNIGDSEPVLKMSFINSDLNVSYIQSLVELDENTFLSTYTENYGEQQAGLFTYVDPAQIADKKVIVLAGMYIADDMKQRIVEHNRSSEEYRIVVKEYQTYNTYDDYSAGYTQLNNDIITGGMPDILLTDNLPVEKYIAKGLLADVNKLLEKDEELSGVEFMQNVLDAYTVNGKLYYVIPTFRAQTFIGKKSILGDKTTWTVKDMQNLLASLPEGTSMFGDITRNDFMGMAMGFCGTDFIDIESGKCNFNSEGFLALMEYAKTLPEELGEDFYGENYWNNYQSQYRDERTILASLYISSFSNMNYQINGYFGEPVTYIGFPTESGEGSYVAASQSYALSAKSKNLDCAWDFIRYYLTDEYQSGIEWGLSIQKKYFKELAQKATERPYYLDENGNKVEYDESFYMNGESITLNPMTQEQVDELISVVESIHTPYYYNTDVINIINEEIPAFYSGQKSAQEVAQIIQSRAQIIVQENQG